MEEQVPVTSTTQAKEQHGVGPFANFAPHAATVGLVAVTLTAALAAMYLQMSSASVDLSAERRAAQANGLNVPTSAADSSASISIPWWGWAILAAIVALGAIGVAWAAYLRKRIEFTKQAAARQELESAADRLREKMELANLVDLNRRLLDRYHGIATEQANDAYRSSRLAMGIGLLLLIGSVVVGWHFSAQGDRLFIGSIGAIGAAFTAYLSRTYMLIYERAIQQLNQYFNQPVMNGYFLTAQRIAESLPSDRKGAVLERIVDSVLESGKEMHRAAAALSATPAKQPSSTRKRKAAKRRTAPIPKQSSQA